MISKISCSLYDNVFEVGGYHSVKSSNTVRLLVPGHFYFYVVSDFLLRENDISVLLL